MSMSVTAPNESRGVWSSLVPYVAPPLAASFAIVPAFRDLVAKSALQRGQTIPSMTIAEIIKGGMRTGPTVGFIVGAQMISHSVVQEVLFEEKNKGKLSSMFASAAIVGIVSAPFLAIFNGQTMGWSVRESIHKFSGKQAFAITIQEAAFVGGLSAADRLAVIMKQKFGDNKGVEYFAAFTAGASGSLAGHPANAALTRWQSGMTVDSFHQLMWGAARKARAIGIFSVAYKFGKETLNATTEK